ncbi:hypothetical protein ZEAMMB73_Zm00001d010624 [Zea mays]|jgi:hypothetical protein|uniref:Uncharacterized protein n=1 Tax=Zea mays TaxID=4577 RepID=K7V0S8_MAIZE|nr:hypothetical protein ZEAMMB73_Zm00001d010624 [Zea mays]
MSEFGGTPLERHCPHQHQGPQKARCRRRRIILCLAFAVLVLLLLAAAAAIALLVMLRTRDLVTELLSVTATGVLPSVVRPAADRLRPPQRHLLPRGPRPEPEPGRVPPRRCRHVPLLPLRDRGLRRGAGPGRGHRPDGRHGAGRPGRGGRRGRPGGLVADVLAGEMEFEART